MAIEGWYYLHENGQLIFKPRPDAAIDIRDSDFARAMWPMDPGDRAGAWAIVVEGLCHGADKARVFELAALWGCDDEDAEHYAKRVGIRLDRDGNMWCATPPGFTNLQESVGGFGETKLEAMADLAKGLGLRPGKMWNASLRDILGGLAKKAAADG
jgi:hypothetical protein